MPNKKTIGRNQSQRMVLDYLKMMADFRGRNAMPEGFVYSCREEFLLKHGKFYQPVEWTGPQYAPKCCFANALLNSVQHPQLFRYVEGVALTEHGFPTAHGWVTDQTTGTKAYDSTWKPHGLAYFGVEFASRRAWESQWEGEGSVLDDWLREWPIFKQEWTGENYDLWKPLTFAEVIEQSEEERQKK